MANSFKESIIGEYNDCGEINIKDFALLGYSIKDDIVNLAYYMSDENDKSFLLWQLFHIEDMEKELKFFNANIHKKINLNIMDEEDRNIVMEFYNNIPEENRYYCSFEPVEIDKDFKYAKCLGIKRDNDIQNLMKFNIPFSIFLRVQIIKNKMFFNVSIDVTIDTDERFESISIHNNSILNYIGCSVMSATVAEFFSLMIENNNKIGLISVIPALSVKIIQSNFVTKEQFRALYKHVSPVNLSNVIIMDLQNTRRVCIFDINKDSVSLYIIGNEEYNECKLLKPYDLIYK